jgi:hypothetical protein
MHLEPIRAFVHSRFGMLTRLTEEMNNRTSTPVTRQAVSKWLHQDAGKRQEPKLGIALVMIEACQAIQCGDGAEAAPV